MSETTDPRRAIPALDRVLKQPEIQELVGRHGHRAVTECLRDILDQARALAERGDAEGLARALTGLEGALEVRVESAMAPSLRPVLNATGVVVHTNLGRAPLSAEAARRAAEASAQATNLEYDLETGSRGKRDMHVEGRLRGLLGAEAAVVVNNCAAAVLLAVNSLAEGREVLVSRGELVEIGGSFRIPEILRKGGARLREVGTTNRTRIGDYRAATGPDTALILRVHPSNYRIVGFTEAPTLPELVALGREKGVPMVEDLGSGLLDAMTGPLAGEPTAREALEAGVDAVTMSGDKLLGGPQAGLVIGRRPVVEAMRSNPLYRALRVDKMTLAALDAVLLDHATGRADERIPVRRMLALTVAQVRARADALRNQVLAECPGLAIEVTDGESMVGGGAAPTVGLPTALLSLDPPLGAEQLATTLRRGAPPVIIRVADGRALLDLRTVPPTEDASVGRALVLALGTGS